MKRLFRCRFLPALLCLALALSLSACGGKDGTTTEDVDVGTLGALSGSKVGSSNVSVPETDHRPTVERGQNPLPGCRMALLSAIGSPVRWPISVSASGATARR